MQIEVPNIDGNGAESKVTSPNHQFKRGVRTVWFEGDTGAFDGATLTLQMRRQGSARWLSTGVSASSEGAQNFEMYGAEALRIATSGTPTDCTAVCFVE